MGAPSSFFVPAGAAGDLFSGLKDRILEATVAVRTRTECVCASCPMLVAAVRVGTLVVDFTPPFGGRGTPSRPAGGGRGARAPLALCPLRHGGVNAALLQPRTESSAVSAS